jgi:hypothetical protein
MEIDELPENDERLLKKAEIKRDEMGRFEQHGAGFLKKSSVLKMNREDIPRAAAGKFTKQHGGRREGAGRPKGSVNKIPLMLKDMILRSLDRVGGEQYLARLAVENSSAFASLLGKILPMTLAADAESNGGSGVKMVFERHIVYPDGRREIEGVTPKSLPAPDASHALPNSNSSDENINDINEKKA